VRYGKEKLKKKRELRRREKIKKKVMEREWVPFAFILFRGGYTPTVSQFFGNGALCVASYII